MHTNEQREKRKKKEKKEKDEWGFYDDESDDDLDYCALNLSTVIPPTGFESSTSIVNTSD